VGLQPGNNIFAFGQANAPQYVWLFSQTSAVEGDPQLTGLRGQSFQVRHPCTPRTTPHGSVVGMRAHIRPSRARWTLTHSICLSCVCRLLLLVLVARHVLADDACSL
jgi:hypothetical protein